MRSDLLVQLAPLDSQVIKVGLALQGPLGKLGKRGTPALQVRVVTKDSKEFRDPLELPALLV